MQRINAVAVKGFIATIPFTGCLKISILNCHPVNERIEIINTTTMCMKISFSEKWRVHKLLY